MPVIRADQARRSETPGGVMTTFASPTQGGTAAALWRVDANPDTAGPPHDFDTEQVWAFTAGAATVELGGETFEVAPGDTVVMPPSTPRRVTAGPEGYSAVVTAAAGATALLADGTVHGVPPWIA
ncbi:cupin domain-containing protein [Microtetraspora fusca]|uniref:AraC family ligand binding domain-containing protein n=1 Tax=Microtetraspora fusca TaxID=1997 RepID=A0ABW6VDE8_MICFU|nr:AraC family ligand binding domain-containing protein [Microtetraspora fusca]